MTKEGIAVGAKRRRISLGLLRIMTFLIGLGGTIMAQTSTSAAVKNIVLVHGAWADGSGWEGV
jgi:hypothetical protein